MIGNLEHMRLAIVHTEKMEWTASPSSTVWRKRLEHTGDIETGRVTSLVRYDANSRFPVHTHPMGEEILVLEGVFSDEHGDYPKGTFLLNPPGFEHGPFSVEGCTIFVKLRQYSGQWRRRVVVHTERMAWCAHAIKGVQVLPLYQQAEYPEEIRLIRVAAGTPMPMTPFPAGEEIFVLEGTFKDEHGQYFEGSWIRYPAGSSHTLVTDDGCMLYVKKGHLGEYATPEHGERPAACTERENP